MCILWRKTLRFGRSLHPALSLCAEVMAGTRHLGWCASAVSLRGRQTARQRCRAREADTCSQGVQLLFILRWLSSTAGVSPPPSSPPSLTPSEALGALRPFYLAVHPDLFTMFPREQAVNDGSLKKLNSYLDSLRSHGRPRPVHLEFYVYPETKGARHTSKPRTIDINLRSLSIGSVVYDLLNSCDLSDRLNNAIKDKLTQIKIQEHCDTRTVAGLQREKAHSSRYPDWEFAFTRSSPKSRHRVVTLDSWLLENLPLAKERLDASRPVREENADTLQYLCDRFSLRAIEVDSEWMATTLRGHLRSLLRLLERGERGMVRQCGGRDQDSSVALDGITLVLGYRSVMDICGRVHLSCEDTLQQWSQFLPSVLHSRQHIEKITAAETQLSILLGIPGATFMRPEGNSPQEYLRWLTQYVSEGRQLEEQYHAAIADTEDVCEQTGTSLEVAVSKESKTPGVAPNGTVHIPTSYPVDRLLGFVQEHQLRARQLKKHHMRRRELTEGVIEQCKRSLGLSKLTRAPAVGDVQMVQSCQRLLDLTVGSGNELESSLVDLLRGQWLCLDCYYTVTADGRMNVPSNFVLS